MFVSVPDFNTCLREPLKVSGNTLYIGDSAAKKLDRLSKGDHTHFLLSRPTGESEIVKYTHRQNYDERAHPDCITIERLSGDRFAYYCGDRVSFVWTLEGIQSVCKGEARGL